MRAISRMAASIKRRSDSATRSALGGGGLAEWLPQLRGGLTLRRVRLGCVARGQHRSRRRVLQKTVCASIACGHHIYLRYVSQVNYDWCYPLMLSCLSQCAKNGAHTALQGQITKWWAIGKRSQWAHRRVTLITQRRARRERRGCCRPMRGCSAQWSESGLSAGNHHEPELRDACQASRSCRHGDGQLLDCGCRLLRVVWWTQRIGARAAFG